MRIGNIVIATSDDLQKMHAAALAVLEKVGMRVMHETFLDRLESYGAKVSRTDRIVRMPAKVVEKARTACMTSGYDESDHFLDVRKMIERRLKAEEKKLAKSSDSLEHKDKDG